MAKKNPVIIQEEKKDVNNGEMYRKALEDYEALRNKILNDSMLTMERKEKNLDEAYNHYVIKLREIAKAKREEMEVKKRLKIQKQEENFKLVL